MQVQLPNKCYKQSHMTSEIGKRTAKHHNATEQSRHARTKQHNGSTELTSRNTLSSSSATLGGHRLQYLADKFGALCRCDSSLGGHTRSMLHANLAFGLYLLKLIQLRRQRLQLSAA